MKKEIFFLLVINMILMSCSQIKINSVSGERFSKCKGIDKENASHIQFYIGSPNSKGNYELTRTTKSQNTKSYKEILPGKVNKFREENQTITNKHFTIKKGTPAIFDSTIQKAKYSYNHIFKLKIDYDTFAVCEVRRTKGDLYGNNRRYFCVTNSVIFKGEKFNFNKSGNIYIYQKIGESKETKNKEVIDVELDSPKGIIID